MLSNTNRLVEDYPMAISVIRLHLPKVALTVCAATIRPKVGINYDFYISIVH